MLLAKSLIRIQAYTVRKEVYLNEELGDEAGQTTTTLLEM